jgi:predicted Fe-Mo cluster-binding NifX family protein
VKVPFGTRLEPDLRQRVKIYAAATDQTIEDVVEAALSGYLPGDPAAAVTTNPAQQDAALAR